MFRGLRVPEGLLDLQGGAVTFFLVGDFSGHLLSAAIPFPVSPRSYRSAGLPVACPTPGVTEKEVATATTRPGGPRAPAQWLLVQDGRGAWPQCVAGGLISVSDSLFNQFRFRVNFPLSPVSGVRVPISLCAKCLEISDSASPRTGPPGPRPRLPPGWR